MIKSASAYTDRQLQVTLFIKDGTIDRACHLCDNCLSLSLDQHRLNEHVNKSCREVLKVLRFVQEHESPSWHFEGSHARDTHLSTFMIEQKSLSKRRVGKFDVSHFCSWKLRSNDLEVNFIMVSPVFISLTPLTRQVAI